MTSIGRAAFYGCGDLRFVQLPSGLKELGVSVFDRCTNLKSIVLPESMKRIGSAAFNRCSALEEIYIPASVTKIEDSAFNGCTKLKTVWYGGSESDWHRVEIAGYNRALTRAAVEYGADPAGHIVSSDIAFADMAGEFSWELSKDGVLLVSAAGRMPDYSIELPPWGKQRDKVKEIVILDGTTHIGAQTFQYCKNADTVIFPSTLESIGDAAFYQCTSLKTVPLPAGVREIGAQAFDRCTGLRTITIPDGVSVIREACFNRCSKLESVYIPATVTRIENSAFNACSSLKDVYFAGTAEDWAAIQVGGYNKILTKVKVHVEGTDSNAIGGGFGSPGAGNTSTGAADGFAGADALMTPYEMYRRGYAYDTGDGVEQNHEKAFEWYSKAADAGDINAMFMLGQMYYTGFWVVEQDFVKAYDWFMRSADGGDQNSMYYLGVLYRLGLGVEKDYDKAFAWYMRSADLGYYAAMKEIGDMYEKGEGVKQNKAKAEEWHAKADAALANARRSG